MYSMPLMFSFSNAIKNSEIMLGGTVILCNLVYGQVRLALILGYFKD